MSLSLAPRRLKFDYLNWKGDEGPREVETRSIWFGTLNKWYPGSAPQWYLQAIDVNKNEERSFRLAAMRNVETADGGSPIDLPPG